ncbi:dihydrolipoamide acetyltransferase family protein [Aquabacterium sp.]|uniref:dihydrolipoamide acetyltransferase family protein n=1 Tax=Aquabacterium sp. TaxID=1872578 RepID=UPI002CE32489|nr:dihydrolipoamide acetyltransferase family protein [Aquabacterium sp.]HSW04294.1 dihydrolipoamide acetyltransferase family protein [Aquabacterium sp.]
MSVHVIKVPDIGEGIAEVELVAWHVKLGDRVVEDQALADVMTDKATVEIPSPLAGTVQALGGEVGQMLAVGAELVRIDGAGGDEMAKGGRPRDVSAAATLAVQPAAVRSAAAAPRTPSAPPGMRPDMRAQARPPTHAPTRPIASPALRARAWELGVNLAEVAATGPAGRTMQADLDAHLARGGSRAAAPAAMPVAMPVAAAPDARHEPTHAATHEIKIIGLRRKIAQRMQESKRRIPHFSYVEEVDVGELEALRAQLNTRWADRRAHLTLLPFLIRAIVLAARDHPQVNARFDDEAGVLTLHDAVHVGIATQTDAGLMVPVLRDAHTRDLWSCAADIARLAEHTRAGRITRDELSGSTITVTSLGRLGGIASTPVINLPEVAIVGVNRIVMRPVMREGAIVGRPMMNLSSSFDHRVVDGALAAAFIQGLRERLEHPALLFAEP